jgi:uncharacterized protein (DUF1697 family)
VICRQIALLRGINLGSHNRIAMPTLKAAFEAAGLADVVTYLQSGNVAFDGETGGITERIQDLIKHSFDLDVPVVVRRLSDINKLIKSQPFASDPSRWHVTFLGDGFNQDAGTTGEAGDDRWHRAGDNVYLEIPGSYGLTKLSNAYFERSFGATATTRNWKTVTALANL